MQRSETWVRVNQHRALKRLAEHLADAGRTKPRRLGTPACNTGAALHDVAGVSDHELTDESVDRVLDGRDVAGEGGAETVGAAAALLRGERPGHGRRARCRRRHDHPLRRGGPRARGCTGTAAPRAFRSPRGWPPWSSRRRSGRRGWRRRRPDIFPTRCSTRCRDTASHVGLLVARSVDRIRSPRQAATSKAPRRARTNRATTRRRRHRRDHASTDATTASTTEPRPPARRQRRRRRGPHRPPGPPPPRPPVRRRLPLAVDGRAASVLM